MTWSEIEWNACTKMWHTRVALYCVEHTKFKILIAIAHPNQQEYKTIFGGRKWWRWHTNSVGSNFEFMGKMWNWENDFHLRAIGLKIHGNWFDVKNDIFSLPLGACVWHTHTKSILCFDIKFIMVDKASVFIGYSSAILFRISVLFMFR